MGSKISHISFPPNGYIFISQYTAQHVLLKRLKIGQYLKFHREPRIK